MMNKIIVFLGCIFFICCNHPVDNEKQNSYPNIIPIIKINKNKISIGTLTKISIKKNINCQAKIILPTESQVCISPSLEGKLKKIYVIPGQYVNKGDRLAILKNIDLIDIQKQYLNTTQQLEYYKEDYKRQGELTLENAVSIKKMQKAKAEFMTLLVQQKSLAYKLSCFGIHSKNLSLEHLTDQFTLYAPMNGQISKINKISGEFIDVNDCLLTILNKDSLCLKIYIPYTKINAIYKGKELTYSHSDDPYKEYASKIIRVESSIDEPSNSVIAYAKITQPTQELLPGMKVNATLIIEDSVYAIPDHALIYNDENPFAYTIQDSHYRKIPIIPGISVDGYTEILNIEEIHTKLFITKGIENLGK